MPQLLGAYKERKKGKSGVYLGKMNHYNESNELGITFNTMLEYGLVADHV